MPSSWWDDAGTQFCALLKPSSALATKPQTLDLPCMNGGGEPGGLGITPLQGGAGRQC